MVGSTCKSIILYGMLCSVV